MKGFKFLSVLALFLSVTVYSETVYVKGQSVSIHASPTSESEKLYSLSNGEEVYVIDRANGWILVEDENYTTSGWISQQNLSKTKPVAKIEEKKSKEGGAADESGISTFSIVTGAIGILMFLGGCGSSGVKDGRTKSGYKKRKVPRPANSQVLLLGLVLSLIAYIFA